MAKGNNEIIQESKLKWGGAIAPVLIMIGVAAALTSCRPKPHTVGSVNTEFKLIGPDHKIVIESYDDPKVDGVTVFISKSQKGGIKGALGLAEDMSYASVAVRQTGPIKVKQAFENGERRLHRTTLVAIQATAREPLMRCVS
jgi:CreA protein